MKIAVLAPPFAAVPPTGQGGTERIAYEMCEGFTKRGHQVTLFAVGDSKISGEFKQLYKIPISARKFDTSQVESSRGLRLEMAYIARVMDELIKSSGEFDVIFNNLRGGYLLSFLHRVIKTPIINILHLPLFPEIAEIFSLLAEPNIVTISNNQRQHFPQLKYLATVYNGINPAEFKFCEQADDYFLFLGAIAEHKNPHEAILACQKTGQKLILAGGKKREPYFTKKIKPLVDGQQIKYIGEVFGKDRTELLRRAKGFLFPIVWQEPFGLVMAEAMAGGTPVIAYHNGAVPEVVKDGQTGFVVKDVAGIVEAIKKINQIDRAACRQRVVDNFTVEKMIDGYEQVAQRVINKK